MNTATVITEFLKWVLTEGVSHGFWHFLAWLLIVGALCKLPRLVVVDLKPERKSDKKADGQ
jgi:hypothetical protein